MVIIYLIALAGTGKYTIAKEFTKYGYKIVDNHLINNPIFSLIECGVNPIDESAWQSVRQIREIVLDFALTLKTDLIFTNELLNTTYDSKLYKKILQFAQKKKAIFVPVRLLISEEERIVRMNSVKRATKFKMTEDLRIIEGKKLDILFIDHDNLLEINVTNLSAKNAAKQISNFVARILL
ncbi:MAG: hypothetical protein ACRYE9_00470 [Janthinobacterium lividum]